MKTDRNRIAWSPIRLATLALLILDLNLVADTTEAPPEFKDIQALAEKGDSKAQYELARFYAKGIGVAKNPVEAAKYMRQSAEQGYSEAQVVLGSFYGRGFGVPRNLDSAIEWYRRAADQGNATAQFAVGGFYSTGRGVTKDMTEAVRWWRKAADQDQVEAQFALGNLPIESVDTLGTNYVSYPEAMRWLSQAASRGSAAAMNSLGVAYENGLGVERDYKEAARCYHDGAVRGESRAQANLGQLYLDGRGVTRDYVQAYKWFQLSASQNDFMGAKGLEHFFGVNVLLSPDELAEAEKLVRDFRPLKSVAEEAKLEK